MSMFDCPNCASRVYIPPGTYTKRCSCCGTVYGIPREPGWQDSIDRLVASGMDALEDGNWDKVRSLCMTIKKLDYGSPECYYLDFMASLEMRDLIELESSDIMFLCKKEYKSFVEYGDTERIERITEIGKRNLRKQQQVLVKFRYNIAKTRCKKATTSKEFRKAAEYFGKTYDFRNSASMRRYCLERAEQIESGIGGKILKWFLPFGA